MTLASATPAATISQARFEAVLVDLDGVVTDTARLHAIAWKEAFDALLADLAKTGAAQPPVPFDTDRDYRRYVDGKPREAGIRAFLAARGVALPEGTPEDPPDARSVHGVGRRKNAAYHRLLAERGVPVHTDAVDLVRRARAAGLATAVVSSSRNTAEVLRVAGLSALFDTRVDGHDLARRGLAGKPAPDLFLLAAERLGVPPARAVVLEDALAGVAAGRAGGFGLVVGVARTNAPAELLAGGADVAIADLRGLAVGTTVGCPPRDLPPALDAVTRIASRARGRRVAVFLDYDGTLTPIVARPDLAVLPPEMRDILRSLARVCTVAVISGRDRRDVARRIDVPDLIYAGSHGFDIAGPAGQRLAHAEGTSYRDELRALAGELRADLADIQGAIVEAKAYGVAVHYRQVPETLRPALDAKVAAARARHPGLTRTGGKKVYEFRPGIPWDKGRAVIWLLHSLDLAGADTLAIYLGDDETDEDAFAALAESGIGILVGEGYGPTRAGYRLDDVDAVRRFLAELTRVLAERRSR